MQNPLSFDRDPVLLVASLRRLADDLERLTMFQPREELVDAPLLANWRLGVRSRPCLVGTAVDHPLLPDGAVRSSELFALDPQLRWARTFSRFYRLD